MGRMDQHGHSNGLGHQLMQEPQPLGCNLPGEIVDAGGVAARPGKAGDKTKLDRSLSDAEDVVVAALAARAPSPQGPLPHAGTRGIPSDGRCRAGPLICLGRAGDACVVGALERVGDTLYGARVYVKLGRRLAHAQFSRSPPSRGPRDRVRDRGRRLSLASCVKNIWYCNSQRQRATQHLWLSVRVQRGANSAKCNSSLHRNGARPVQGLLERLTLALGILVPPLPGAGKLGTTSASPSITLAFAAASRCASISLMISIERSI